MKLHPISPLYTYPTVFQSPTGRNFFLSPQPTNVLKPDADLEYALAKLVPFTEHKNTIRRGGVASTIKYV
jgi:hypothetical protein